MYSQPKSPTPNSAASRLSEHPILRRRLFVYAETSMLYWLPMAVFRLHRKKMNSSPDFLSLQMDGILGSQELSLFSSKRGNAFIPFLQLTHPRASLCPFLRGTEPVRKERQVFGNINVRIFYNCHILGPPFVRSSEGWSLFGRRDRYLGILMSVFSASAITIAQPNDAQTAHHDDQNMQINDRANI